MRVVKTVRLYLLVLLVFVTTLCLRQLNVSADTTDVLGINNGSQYYIRNKATGQYLDVQKAEDSNGTNVIVYNFKGESNQKWKLERISSSTYKFETLCSSAGRVLDITGTNIDIWKYTGANYQKFIITRNTDGTYYIKNGSKYVAVSGSNVVLTTSDSSAKWTIDPCNKDNAYFFGYTYSNKSESYSSMGASAEFCSNLGKIGYNTYSYKNPKASLAASLMKNSSIWCFRGHGSAGRVVFYDTNGNETGNIVAVNLNYNNQEIVSSFANNSLAKAKCIMYIGCSTGVSTSSGYNLVSETYKKGAHCVIGTTETVYTATATEWTEYFCNWASTGSATIADCIEYANLSYLGFPLYIKGDSNCKIN